MLCNTAHWNHISSILSIFNAASNSSILYVIAADAFLCQWNADACALCNQLYCCIGVCRACWMRKIGRQRKREKRGNSEIWMLAGIRYRTYGEQFTRDYHCSIQMNPLCSKFVRASILIRRKFGRFFNTRRQQVFDTAIKFSLPLPFYQDRNSHARETGLLKE